MGASLVCRAGRGLAVPRPCLQASGSVARSAVRARFPAPRAWCLHAEGLQSEGEAMSLLALWSVFLHKKVIAKNFS